MRPLLSKLFGSIAVATRGRVGPAAHGWPVERSAAAPINSRFIDIDTPRVYVSVATLGDK